MENIAADEGRLFYTATGEQQALLRLRPAGALLSETSLFFGTVCVQFGNSIVMMAMW